MSDVTKLALLAVLTELLAGCTPHPPIGSCAPDAGVARSTADTSGTGVVVSAIGGGTTCSPWGCGTNSPTIGDGILFDELDSSQTMEDAHGIKITKAVLDDGDDVDLHVIRDRLSANRRKDPGRMLSDEQLKRITITVSVRRDTGNLEFELRIDDINLQILSYWAGPREVVPAYLVTARQTVPTVTQFEHICRITSPPITEPQWRSASYYALMFAGDRYDPAAKTVADAPPDTTWFNLACAATAPAKMHLMRHTNAGAGPTRAYATTIAERIAMLKMFTADYCGDGNNKASDGTMYTIDGQPLLYDDSRHWYTPLPGVPTFTVNSSGALSPAGTTMEALWTPTGAACLTTPRRVPRGIVCPGRSIPACKPEQIARWASVYHVISVNPPCPP
jgi:hypothetical protein